MRPNRVGASRFPFIKKKLWLKYTLDIDKCWKVRNQIMLYDQIVYVLDSLKTWQFPNSSSLNTFNKSITKKYWMFTQ